MCAADNCTGRSLEHQSQRDRKIAPEVTPYEWAVAGLEKPVSAFQPIGYEHPFWRRWKSGMQTGMMAKLNVHLSPGRCSRNGSPSLTNDFFPEIRLIEPVQLAVG